MEFTITLIIAIIVGLIVYKSMGYYGISLNNI